jgi:hypothetical protein
MSDTLPLHVKKSLGMLPRDTWFVFDINTVPLLTLDLITCILPGSVSRIDSCLWEDRLWKRNTSWPWIKGRPAPGP